MQPLIENICGLVLVIHSHQSWEFTCPLVHNNNNNNNKIQKSKTYGGFCCIGFTLYSPMSPVPTARIPLGISSYSTSWIKCCRLLLLLLPRWTAKISVSLRTTLYVFVVVYICYIQHKAGQPPLSRTCQFVCGSCLWGPHLKIRPPRPRYDRRWR